MVLRPLNVLAAFGLVVACAIAGAAGWALLRERPITSDAQNPPEPGATTEEHGPAPATFAVENPGSDRHLVAGNESEQPPPAAAPETPPRPVTGEPPAAASQQRLAQAKPAPRRTINELIRADEFLRQGNLAGAKKIYEAEIELGGSAIDPVIHFRSALCAESLGLLDDALERYQGMADRSASPAWTGFALWGVGRILQQQRRTELAANIAAGVRLRQDEEAAHWRSDLAHWYGQVMYQRVLGDAPPDLLASDSFVQAPWRFRTSDLLAVCARIHDAEIRGVGAAERRAPSGVPGELQVRLPAGRVAVALQEIADRTGVTLEFSRVSQPIAESRDCRIATAAHPSLLLDAICEPTGLAWSSDGRQLRIVAGSELTAIERQQWQRDIALRAMHNGLGAAPVHRWAAYSQFAIAHIAMLQGDLAGSLSNFEALISSYPGSPLLGEAWFNIGKLHLRSGRGGPAVAAFERSVDHTAGTTLAPLADLYLGRLLLEANEPRRAVLALRRSTAMATSQLRMQSTVSLAAAHLASGHPEQANEVLRASRAELDVPATRNAAAFLSSLSQVRGARDVYRRKHDRETLMSAVSRVSSSDFFGWQGAELIADAYRELGLSGEAASVCRHAVQHMPDCPLRSRMRLTLAEDEVQRGDYSAAEATLRDILAQGETTQHAAARKRLCDLLLSRDRVDDAQSESQAWLEQASQAAEQAEALRVLGRCLERKGDRLNAALCFAGSRPTLGGSPSTSTTAPGEFKTPELPETLMKSLQSSQQQPSKTQRSTR